MRAINISFIVLFMLMVTLPLVCVDLSKDRVSAQENRMLANPPGLADITNHPIKFIRQFDRWFKDSTGFRKQLVAIYNVVDKNKLLTGIMYREGSLIFLVGEQGHHYSIHGVQIQKFQGKQILSDEKLQDTAAKLDEIKTYLDRKGIPLTVMLCADKETIYPEFFPKAIKRGPDPVQVDVITTYLQEHTSVDVFNIREALLAEKDNYMLYPIIDNWSNADVAHYNQIGAFFAYRELMKHINIHFPQIIPYRLDDIEISYNEINLPSVNLKIEKPHEKLDASFFDDVNINRPFTSENDAYVNAEQDLPVILLISDSYAMYHYFGKYIVQHFGKTIFIHLQNMKYFDEYVTKYNPDMVVIEAAERSLKPFADWVAEVPALP